MVVFFKFMTFAQSSMWCLVHKLDRKKRKLIPDSFVAVQWCQLLCVCPVGKNFISHTSKTFLSRSERSEDLTNEGNLTYSSDVFLNRVARTEGRARTAAPTCHRRSTRYSRPGRTAGSTGAAWYPGAAGPRRHQRTAGRQGLQGHSGTSWVPRAQGAARAGRPARAGWSARTPWIRRTRGRPRKPRTNGRQCWVVLHKVRTPKIL